MKIKVLFLCLLIFQSFCWKIDYRLVAVGSLNTFFEQHLRHVEVSLTRIFPLLSHTYPW